LTPLKVIEAALNEDENNFYSEQIEVKFRQQILKGKENIRKYCILCHGENEFHYENQENLLVLPEFLKNKYFAKGKSPNNIEKTIRHSRHTSTLFYDVLGWESP
jgi:hypothetical protein